MTVVVPRRHILVGERGRVLPVRLIGHLNSGQAVLRAQGAEVFEHVSTGGFLGGGGHRHALRFFVLCHLAAGGGSSLFDGFEFVLRLSV